MYTTFVLKETASFSEILGSFTTLHGVTSQKPLILILITSQPYVAGKEKSSSINHVTKTG
jgi:hypothetical protein